VVGNEESSQELDDVQPIERCGYFPNDLTTDRCTCNCLGFLDNYEAFFLTLLCNIIKMEENCIEQIRWAILRRQQAVILAILPKLPDKFG